MRRILDKGEMKMGSVQIIGGGNLTKAFTDLGIAAAKIYQSDEDQFGIEYQVWEIPTGEFEVLEAFADEEWQSDFGWYRTAGCNDTSELIEFTVNGQTMLGFKNENSWYHSEDYLSELEEGEQPKLPNYKNFTTWFSEYQGLSKPENLAYFAATLAEKNGLSKAEFFEKYQGSTKSSVASLIAFSTFPTIPAPMIPARQIWDGPEESTMPELKITESEKEAKDLSAGRLEPIFCAVEVKNRIHASFITALEAAAKKAVESLIEERISHYETALKYCRHSKKRVYISKKLNRLSEAYEQWRKENVSDSD